MIVLRLAQGTIQECPNTGTIWENHPYPEEDGIPEYSDAHCCGAQSWALFRHWWHDTDALLNASETHVVYAVYVPDECVLVGRTQVMFRPPDAYRIQRLDIFALLEHEARGANMDWLISHACQFPAQESTTTASL